MYTLDILHTPEISRSNITLYWKEIRYQGAVSIRKTVLLGMVIPMLKIRRPTGRLIFNMGIPIPGKTVFYIETGPSLFRLWPHTRHPIPRPCGRRSMYGSLEKIYREISGGTVSRFDITRPDRRQAIIWASVGILLTGPLRINFSKILIKIHTFSFKKMR